MKKAKEVLKQVLEKINPSNQELKEIKKKVNLFSASIKKNLKKYKIDGQIFIGGSFAKGTVIKKDKYDVDVFIRYSPKYKNEELPKLTEKLLLGQKNVRIIHGSRDYFRISISENFFIELIPVKRIKNPKEHENITDLSYLHVNYINKKVKNKKILDEIKITKAFCYAIGCYGAESYIRGFSGYSLELLIYYYKSFEKFLKAMSKIQDEKTVIDIEKQFKNKKEVLMDLNTSKLESPIILIDPTYKHRNALAALSKECFLRFQGSAREFLKKPSISQFEPKKTDIEKLKLDALNQKKEFILIEAKTGKPEGDVAGSKLLKFYNHLGQEISKYFDISDKGFEYLGNDSGRYFFTVEKKKQIIFPGPYKDDKENSDRFRLEHKEVYEKEGKLYAKGKVDFSIKEFINIWKIKNQKRVKEMYIEEINYL